MGLGSHKLSGKNYEKHFDTQKTKYVNVTIITPIPNGIMI